MEDPRHDIHSYSQPVQVQVKHADLDLTVLFLQHILQGSVILTLDRKAADAPLLLDTRKLAIQAVEADDGHGAFQTTKWELGREDTILGSSLSITLPTGATRVRIQYETTAGAMGLQWLEAPQTAGKHHPFLFSQSQAIQARSWIPLQDSPGVRMTYTATIHTPKELLAVMSAENDPNAPRTGVYHFRLKQPIPSYLIALAVGDLTFQPTGPRTGVYAERSVVAKAAREFEDTEKMIEAVEQLYGPYRWGRYDLLVLPPSFPFGGMENPLLTFCTPTVIAGDKSLVSLIAHELAHSWSGNLVTNATWRDFWLNEGVTTYVENRIQEKVYGRKQADMEVVLDRQELDDELASFDKADQILHIDLKGRDPDDGATRVPYVKGALLMRQLELTFGRAEFDQFLRGYFDHFAFQSITTADFENYLRENLLNKHSGLASRIPLEQWLNEPGLPENAPRPSAEAFTAVEHDAEEWLHGRMPLSAIPVKSWTTQEWLRFLTALPPSLEAGKLRELDKAFSLTSTGNDEILDQWLLMSIRGGYQDASPRLEEFLTTVGRRKYIRPLYEELMKTPEGRERAKAIYAKARPFYHPIAQSSIDTVVK